MNYEAKYTSNQLIWEKMVKSISHKTYRKYDNDNSNNELNNRHYRNNPPPQNNDNHYQTPPSPPSQSPYDIHLVIGSQDLLLLHIFLSPIMLLVEK